VNVKMQSKKQILPMMDFTSMLHVWQCRGLK